MILADVNPIIHAYNTGFPNHTAARDWWEGALNGTEAVGLAWVTVLGFVRIMTHPRILQRPMTVEAAVETVHSWLELSVVEIVHPGDRHAEIWTRLLREAGTAGNLTTDAHLAALAIEHRARLASTDTDFARFQGLRWFNPLARP